MILDCNEILPDRLCVGRFIRPEDVTLLRRISVTAVVSLQSDKELISYGINVKKLLKAYSEADIDLHQVAIPDFDKETLAANLDRCIAAIETALAPRWAKVYLHCAAGVNRGPTVAAAYLIRNCGYSARDAHDFVIARRHCRPYLEMLEQYEASMKAR